MRALSPLPPGRNRRDKLSTATCASRRASARSPANRGPSLAVALELNFGQRFVQNPPATMSDHTPPSHSQETSYVLYCLIPQRAVTSEPERFFLIEKQGHPAFPPTKFRADEDLFRALESDLGLPPESYFPEKELPTIPHACAGGRYPGLNKQWFLYPATVSLTDAGWAALERCAGHWTAWDAWARRERRRATGRGRTAKSNTARSGSNAHIRRRCWGWRQSSPSRGWNGIPGASRKSQEAQATWLAGAEAP